MKSFTRNRTALSRSGRPAPHRGLFAPYKQTRRGPKRIAATLVEFAIVSNLLIISIAACMEFTRMNMARNLVQDAAYFAARSAIVPGATASEAEAEGERIMSSIFSNGYTVTCSGITDDTEQVVVRVTVNLDEVAFFVPMFLAGVEIESTASMKTERYSGYYQQ